MIRNTQAALLAILSPTKNPSLDLSKLVLQHEAQCTYSDYK
jgi:hypothetical protein